MSLAFKLPGFHVYVVAPEAVINVGLPAHITAFATTGVAPGKTVTVPVPVPLQVPFVPTTLYTCVLAGLNVCVAPNKFPGVHVNPPELPVAVKVAILVGQIVAEPTEITGDARTFTVLVKRAEAPFEFEHINDIV